MKIIELQVLNIELLLRYDRTNYCQLLKSPSVSERAYALMMFWWMTFQIFKI